ncbi:MAG: hypothetical protein IPK58_24200 [Acidobacteria bacterium]|nr:hypothetical protein [Acidobacteriota bacterium]
MVRPRSSPDFRFQISDFRFQISDSKFQIPNSRFQIPDFRFQIFQIQDSGGLKTRDVLPQRTRQATLICMPNLRLAARMWGKARPFLTTPPQSCGYAANRQLAAQPRRQLPDPERHSLSTHPGGKPH